MPGPELEVAGAELRGAGDGYGAEFEQAGEDRVPLGYLAEEYHHPVAAAHTHLAGYVGEAVGEPGEVAEGQPALFAARSEPDHGWTVLFPPVDHISSEVEPLWRLPVEPLVGGRVVADVRHYASLPLSLVPYFTRAYGPGMTDRTTKRPDGLCW